MPWGPLVWTGIQAEDREDGWSAVLQAARSRGTRLDRQWWGAGWGGCPLSGGPSSYCPRALDSEGSMTSHVTLGAFALKGMAASGAKHRGNGHQLCG